MSFWRKAYSAIVEQRHRHFGVERLLEKTIGGECNKDGCLGILDGGIHITTVVTVASPRVLGLN